MDRWTGIGKRQRSFSCSCFHKNKDGLDGGNRKGIQKRKMRDSQDRHDGADRELNDIEEYHHWSSAIRRGGFVLFLLVVPCRWSWIGCWARRRHGCCCRCCCCRRRRRRRVGSGRVDMMRGIVVVRFRSIRCSKVGGSIDRWLGFVASREVAKLGAAMPTGC